EANGYEESSAGLSVPERSLLQRPIPSAVVTVPDVYTGGNSFASSGSDREQQQQQGYPLLGVRAVLGEPNPPRSSDYYSILLLSSENLECVIDWGLRLTPSGRTVLGVHFNKGTPQQAADFSIRAIRRAQEVNPGVEFEITVRPSCASIIPIAAELSRHCRFLVIGDSGKTNTRHREM
ncbi:hypothetical protein FOZ63_012867, partial [Perkinsus olseni]